MLTAIAVICVILVIYYLAEGIRASIHIRDVVQGTKIKMSASNYVCIVFAWPLCRKPIDRIEVEAKRQKEEAKERARASEKQWYEMKALNDQRRTEDELERKAKRWAEGNPDLSPPNTSSVSCIPNTYFNPVTWTTHTHEKEDPHV